MLGAILVLIIVGFLSFSIVDRLKNKYPFIDGSFLKKLFFYHLLLSTVYYLYSLFEHSDSRSYYIKVISDFRGTEWFDFYGISTPFIEFIAYPFIKYLGFSYEAMMVLFAFLGYLGFLYIYIFFKERIRFAHKFMGFNLLNLFFLLPNLHFWSSSLGKGSIIFLGISLFFFGIGNVKSRWLAVLIGGLITYNVRPHVMLVILVSTTIGFVFSSKEIKPTIRIIFLVAATIAFFYIYQDVLRLVGIDDDELISEGLNLSHRAKELSKATSGIDITHYSLPQQLFAFLYRPLFFDSPGILGIIVSIENVFYLLMTLWILNRRGIRFIFWGDFLIRSAFLSFVTISIALAQISGNLGLAIRQKSQVMILFLFVIISFLDEQKLLQLKKMHLKRKEKQKFQKVPAQ